MYIGLLRAPEARFVKETSINVDNFAVHFF